MTWIPVRRRPRRPRRSGKPAGARSRPSAPGRKWPGSSARRSSARGIPPSSPGGAVVSIYSDNESESNDLDFVRIGLARRVDAAMERLGFRKEGRHWRRPRTAFWVDFPPGPVQVGDAVVTAFAERSTPFGVLRLLAPTECVMDRLAGHYDWDDPQCLEQALAVARRQPLDLDRLEEWSHREQASERFLRFRGRLEGGTP